MNEKRFKHSRSGASISTERNHSSRRSVRRGQSDCRYTDNARTLGRRLIHPSIDSRRRTLISRSWNGDNVTNCP